MNKKIIENEIKWWDWIFLFWFLVFVLWLVCGCASQTRKTTEMNNSTHYVAETETGRYQPGRYGPRTYGPTSVYQSETRYQRLEKGGYWFRENRLGFSEGYWRFNDSNTKSFQVVPHWTTRWYHYP